MKTYEEVEIQLHAVSVLTYMEVSFASVQKRSLSAKWAGGKHLLTPTEN
jgi:hypothetical protein